MTAKAAFKAACAAVALSAVALAAGAEERKFDLSGFDAIDATAGLEVKIRQGDSFSVVASARSEKALNHLDFSLDGTTLKLDRKRDLMENLTLLAPHRAVSVTVQMPELNALDASAGASVKAEGLSVHTFTANLSSGAEASLSNLTAGDVVAKASSGASLTLGGKCDSLDADASSGANIEAGQFACTSVQAHASSGASVAARGKGPFGADASGGGTITVLGHPAKLEAHESFGGRITSE